MTYGSKDRPSLDVEIGKGQTFTEYESAQDEYLINSETNENIDQTYRQDRLGNNDHGQLSQLYEDTKTDKVQNLRRVIKLIERGM